MLTRCIFSMMSTFVVVNGGTLNDSTTLVNNLLARYNKNVRPVENHKDKTDVGVYTYLKTIQEFDEVKEVLTYTGGFNVFWHDAAMVWDPAAYGGVESVKISYRYVWVPDLILTTPSEELDSFGKPWQMVEYDYTGDAVWSPGGLIKSTCSVDVSKYPFDKQSCTSDFNVWGYYKSELEIYSISDKADLSVYSGNVAWVLEDTAVRATTDGPNWSMLEVTFHLRRKSTFIVVNILMPILFLSLINVLVFLLVPQSGERVSYCITVLLAIAVFMTIISDTLPKSSEPLPVISYKLMLDMVISSLITLVTILNLGLYNKDDNIPVPTWLKSLYITLYRSKRCKSNPKLSDRKIAPNPTTDVMVIADVDDKDFIITDRAANKKRESIKQFPDSVTARLEQLMSESGVGVPDVTWIDISKMVDCISLCVFTILSILSFAVFLIYSSQG